MFVIARLSEIQKDCSMDIQRDVQVIERTLKKKELKQNALAEAMGIRVPAITELFQGTRRLKLEEREKAFAFLGLDSVPLVGYASAGDAIEFNHLPPDENNRVVAPEEVSENTVAVEIRGSSLGEAIDGWVAYYDRIEHRRVTRALDNCLCVIGLSDGTVFIKRLVPSKSDKRFYHLMSNTGADRLDVPASLIEWASPVTSLRPKRLAR
jgi:transcriptional regulator with XRE-family HTH domain